MTPVRPTLRDAGPGDRDAIAALHLASWRDAYGVALPRAYLDGALARDLAARWAARDLAPPLLTLCAWDAEGGDLAGFLCCETDRAVPYVDNLHAHPARRGEGIGRALMAGCGARLRAMGHAACELTVLEANPAARRFYRRLGGAEGAPRDAAIFGHPVREVPVRFDLATLAGP